MSRHKCMEVTMGRKRATLTKDDWIRAAMELLRTRGIEGVRVLTLAQKLRVSRGSFYWHFENRQDLLDSMLDWWDREMTDPVIKLANATRGGAEKRLLVAGESILRDGYADYELAVRSWADGDKQAARVLRRVLNKRLNYISSLFREVGFSPSEAEARGHLLAIYLMSEGTIHLDESLERRLQLLRRQIRSLTR